MSNNTAKPLLVRLVRNITVVGDCWHYRYVNEHGYGSIGIRSDDGKYRSRRAHRVSYEVFVGKIPDGLDLDHMCHTTSCKKIPCPHRRCINPQHLKPATRKVNLRRGNHNNRDRTHCRRGHEFTKKNTYITSNGSRQCMDCVKLRQPGPRVYSHCKNGHKFDARNDRQQICRICARARNNAYKQKLREKRLLLA